VATHLYRIAQEAINNSIRHGKSREIEVRLRRHGASVQLLVTDWGSGFPKEGFNNSGMGLRIMKYRASMIGASLDFEPSPDQGVTVLCTLRTA
jgi:signal transduction histidine kinase